MTASSADGPTYTLGDSEVAGDRLALLSQVFDPTSRALLQAVGATGVELAVDLGCGPGHTTRLLAEVTRARQTIGLDRSPAFIRRAQAADEIGLAFVQHDVTAVPFPIPPADVLFARYLLAHLPSPLDVVQAWGTQLAPDGRLVLDEVEHIDTSVATFARYLEIAGTMIESYGADLYVGGCLREADAPAGLELVSSGTAVIAPSTSVVARIFAMNLATWRTDPWVTEHIDGAEIAHIDGGLHELAARDAHGEIVWTHRQVVYRPA